MKKVMDEVIVGCGNLKEMRGVTRFWLCGAFCGTQNIYLPRPGSRK